MAEDLTTFTESDAGGYLTVATSSATVALMPTNAICYLKKDYTANYFNALSINFEGYLNSDSQQYCMMNMGLTVDTHNDVSGWGTEDIRVAMRDEAGGGVYCYLQRGYGVESDDIILDFNTLYYFRLLRNAGSATVELKIYSDSNRTTLVDTLTLTGFNTATKWRYMFAMVSEINGLTNRGATGYYQNYNFTTGYILTAEAGAFNLTGVDVNFNKGYVLSAGTGSFTLTGIDALFSKGYTMVCQAGSFILTGMSVIFKWSRGIFRNQQMHPSTFINQDKATTAIFTNKAKNTATFTNQTKHIL